ncbi:MAG: hypothetical protein ABI333_09415 [bacterium]
MTRIAKLALFTALLLIQPACKPRALHYDAVTPGDGVATDITLEVYSDGWGTLVETISLDTEGAVVIEPYEEQPFSEPPQYYVYARAAGYYTELYLCSFGETIDVDLDVVPQRPDALAGVIFQGDDYFAHSYFANRTVEVEGPDGEYATISTDHQGRFGLAGVAAGRYLFTVSCEDEPHSHTFELQNTAATDYDDFVFYPDMFARAPNLYLYPETTTDISVTLDFPLGGQVVESEPPYWDGWRVRVDPDGLIDGRFGYLFYEAKLPRRAQTEQGWVLDGRELDTALRGLITRLGFRGREVDDFVEYWAPELTGFPWLAVYPLEPESLVTLTITPAPERIRRVLLLVRPLEHPLSLPAPPTPEPLSREGYTAFEWGVVFDG